MTVRTTKIEKVYQGYTIKFEKTKGGRYKTSIFGSQWYQDTASVREAVRRYKKM